MRRNKSKINLPKDHSVTLNIILKKKKIFWKFSTFTLKGVSQLQNLHSDSKKKKLKFSQEDLQFNI